MWGNLDSLADNGRPCSSLVKTQKRSEPTKKLQETGKSEQFQLLIFGGSITKIISPSVIVSCDKIEAVNYSTGRSQVRGIYEQIRALKKDHGNVSLKSITIHVGTNHLRRHNTDVTKKIAD